MTEKEQETPMQQNPHITALNTFGGWKLVSDTTPDPLHGTVAITKTSYKGYSLSVPIQNTLHLSPRELLSVYSWCMQHITELEQEAKQEEQAEAEIFGGYDSLEDSEDDTAGAAIATITETDDTEWIHREAGFVASFEWQDEGSTVEIDSTTILGELPHSPTEEPIWVVCVEGTADSGHGYSYPTTMNLTVTRKPDGTPVVDDASETQLELVTLATKQIRE